MKVKIKDAVLYKIVRPILTFGFKILFTPKIIGKENIPSKESVILAGNHTNNLDCLILISSTKRSIHFLAKIELWHGLKKIIFANMGLIPVDRKTKNHQALVIAEEYLKADKLVGIFPEGTTEKQRGMLPFKIGAVKIAKNTNSKIVPFAISGKYCLFSKDLTIVFGKPIMVKDDLELENKRLEEKIFNLMKGDNNEHI